MCVPLCTSCKPTCWVVSRAEGGDQSQHGLLIRPADYASCFHGEGQDAAGDPHFVCSVRNPGDREGPSVAFELQVRTYSMLYEDLYAR